jgi:hypothetical protein
MAFNIFSGSGKRVADGPPYAGVKTAFDGEPALLFDYSAGAPSPFCDPFRMGDFAYSSVSAKIELNPILSYPLHPRPCLLSGTYAPVSSGFPVTSRPAKMW